MVAVGHGVMDRDGQRQQHLFPGSLEFPEADEGKQEGVFSVRILRKGREVKPRHCDYVKLFL